jgi:hypothetical protein
MSKISPKMFKFTAKMQILKKIKVSKTSENVEKNIKLPINLPKYPNLPPKCKF